MKSNMNMNLLSAFDNSHIASARDYFSRYPLILEGANGSLGLSFCNALEMIGASPPSLLLTTNSSDVGSEWQSAFPHAKTLFRSNKQGSSIISELLGANFAEANVLYCAGYGQPNKFLGAERGIVEANISQLFDYVGKKLNSFSFMSSSEVYAGMPGNVAEDSLTMLAPTSGRAPYVEAKRLGEALAIQMIGAGDHRVCCFRVALAFPPRLIDGDTRVMNDLIVSGINNGEVRLRGGKDLIRQYQYGPLACLKMLSAVANGTSEVYNNAGDLILTLGELANEIAKALKVKATITEERRDKTAPDVVRIDATRINKESGYSIESDTLELQDYLNQLLRSLKKNV